MLSAVLVPPSCEKLNAKDCTEIIVLRNPASSRRAEAQALGGAAIAALIRASASGESQLAGPTSLPSSRPSRPMSNVAGMPTAFSAANSLPVGSV